MLSALLPQWEGIDLPLEWSSELAMTWARSSSRVMPLEIIMPDAL